MVKVKIDRLNDQLEGIGYVDGKIIFIPKVKIGEEVDVEITKVSKSFLRGKLINKSSSIDCPYFYDCGGCSLRNFSYDDTLKLKIDNLKHLLDKNKIEYPSIDVIKNEFPYNYRNKISLKIVDKKIGFYEENSNYLTVIDKCLIAKKEINKFINEINKFDINNGFITIRCNYNNELIIIIETKDVVNINIEDLSKKFKIAGIILNNKSIYNDEYFFDKINNDLFKISYDSFFQVNNYCAGKIFNIIENNIEDNDEVLDLYCGVGTLSIVAAKKAKNVTGIEIIKNAILNALVNKKMNKVDNVDFILGDVPKTLSKVNKRFNTVIFDPPRAGLDKFTINYTLDKKPDKIIYVSCNPITLVRDLIYLKDLYIIKSIDLIDMFSFTHHYETICILKKNKDV